MARKINATETDRREARETLRALFPIDSEVTVHVSEVSRSGMGARTLTVLAVDKCTYDHAATGKRKGAPYIRNVSRLVSTILGMPYTDGEGCRSHGSGMDMAFHLVYSLGRTLYGDEHRDELTRSQRAAVTRWKGRQGSNGSTDAGYSLNVRHM